MPETVYATKALRKFLATLTQPDEVPCCSILAPSSAANVAFFGEQLGCKIFVEDLYADIDRHDREGTGAAICPPSSPRAFPQADGSVDGILCWDLLDFLEPPAAQALAAQLMRVLRA